MLSNETDITHHDSLPVTRDRTPQERVESLILTAFRDPAVFAEARQHLSLNAFADIYGDPVNQLAWSAALRLTRRFGDAVLAEPGWPDQLVGEIRAHDPDGDSALYHDSLFGPAGLVARLWRASGCPPTPTEIAMARDTIRCVGIEREVYDRLQRLLRMAGDGRVISDVTDVLEKLGRKARSYDAIGPRPARSFHGEWAEHQRRLEMYRGRDIIGLRTGLRELDDRTLGLRGLITLGAPANVGKTALAVQLGLGVADPANANDAVFLFISLEMDRWSLYDRIVCNRAGLAWKTLRFGSPSLRGGSGPGYFTAEHQQMLDRAEGELLRGELGRRVRVFDPETFGSEVTAAGILARLAALKAETGATRALVAVDYLQLLPVPDEVARRGDLEADKYRVRLLQDVAAGTRTAANPAGDAVLAISETRKPAGGSRSSRRQLEDFMGSARVGYAADAAILYRPMTDDEIGRHYPDAAESGKEHRLQLEADGVAPIILDLAKGRDGTRRGEWAAEFRFAESRFRELPSQGRSRGPAATPPRPAARRPRQIGYVPAPDRRAGTPAGGEGDR